MTSTPIRTLQLPDKNKSKIASLRSIICAIVTNTPIWTLGLPDEYIKSCAAIMLEHPRAPKSRAHRSALAQKKGYSPQVDTHVQARISMYQIELCLRAPTSE